MEGRYQVQERLAGWGPAGQARLADSCVAVVGLGGLGGLAAALLARAGVGHLRLIDPDRVSLDNLHRQLLYTEEDAAQGRPKADAARETLSRTNSRIQIEAVPVAFGPGNSAELLSGANLALDCLDRAASRQDLARACHQMKLPYVHAGVVGNRGQVLAVLPGKTPCLACWFPSGREPSVTTATAGVSGPAAACLASLQANEAIKLLLGSWEELLKGLLLVELWPPSFRVLGRARPLGPQCPICAEPAR